MKEVLTQLEQMGGQLARIGQRLDQMDGRFDQMDGRLDRMDGRFDQMDGRFDRMDGRFDQMDGRFDQIDGQLLKQGVLLESVSADVKMALEGIAGNREVMDKHFADMAEKLDQRVQPIEHASRYLSRRPPK
jgi:predicted nuclease with TOPRIM domain